MQGHSGVVLAAVGSGLAVWGLAGCGGHGAPALPDGRRDVLWESEWSTPAEPAGQVQPLGMTQGEDGSLLVTGSIEDDAAQRHELLIQRLEPDGRLRWSRRYGLPGPDSFWALSVCPAAFTTDGGICAGVADSILKLDAAGQTLWLAPSPWIAPSEDNPVYASRLSSLWPGPDGGVIAVYDRWEERIPTEDGTGFVYQSTTAAVLRLDSAGQPVWANAIGPVTEEFPEDPSLLNGYALGACAVGSRTFVGGWVRRTSALQDWPVGSSSGGLLIAINQAGGVEWQGLWAPGTDDGKMTAGALSSHGGRLFFSSIKTDDGVDEWDATVGVFSTDGALLRETRLGQGSRLMDIRFQWSPSGPVLIAGFHTSNRFAFRDVLFFELDGNAGVRRVLRRNALSPLVPITAAIDPQGNYTFLCALPEDDPLLSGWEEVEWPVGEGQGRFVPSQFETVPLHPRFPQGIEVEAADCPGAAPDSPLFDRAQGVIGLHKVKAP